MNTLMVDATSTKLIYRFKGETTHYSKTFRGNNHGSKAYQFFRGLKHLIDWHEFQGVHQ